MGIRSDTSETNALLRQLLAQYLIDDPDVPASYSIRLERENQSDASSVRPLPRLYRGTCVSVRDREPAQIVRALRIQLDAHRAAGAAEALVLPGIALLHRNGAMIVPVSWERALAAAQRRLADGGLRLIPAPAILLEPETGMLGVPGPGLDVDEGALGAVGETAAELGGHPRRVTTWIVRAGAHPSLAEVPRVEVIATALRWAHNTDLLGRDRSLRTVVAAAGRARLLSGRSLHPAEIVPALLRSRSREEG